MVARLIFVPRSRMRLTRSSASKCRCVEKISSNTAVRSRVTFRPLRFRNSSKTRRSSVFPLMVEERCPRGKRKGMVQLHLSLDAEPRNPLQIRGSGPPEHPERQERGVPRNGPAERREPGQDAVLREVRLPFEDAQGRPRHEGRRERRPPGLLVHPRPAQARNVDRDRRREEVRLQDARDDPDPRPARGLVVRDVPSRDRARAMTSFAGSQPPSATTTRPFSASRATSAGTSLFSPRFSGSSPNGQRTTRTPKRPACARSQRYARRIASRGTRPPAPTFTRTTLARGAGETRPLAWPLPAARSIVRVPCSAPVPGAPYRNGTARRPVTSTHARTRRAVRSGWR